MQNSYFENREYWNYDLTQFPFELGEYDNCIFNNCNFSNMNLSEFVFVECVFDNCNLSLANIESTVLNDVDFNNCKLFGLDFSKANEFGLKLNLKDCALNFSIFSGLKLKNIHFVNCQLIEVDFTKCDLTSSIFENCNLDRADFDQTILIKSDFRSSTNYSIDPEKNSIKKAKFSLNGAVGLLSKYDIIIE